MSRQPVFEPALDFLDHLGIGLLHVGDALHNFDLLLAGQADEDFARLLRRKMGQDQRDRLRMLILNERQQVFAFRFLKERKRRGLDLLGDLLDDAIGISGR